MQRFKDIEETLIIQTIKDSFSVSEIFRKLNVHTGPMNRQKLQEFITSHNIDKSHFDKTKTRIDQQTKYEIIKQKCPVCEKMFTCRSGGKRYKTTCSSKCSNTFFSYKKMTDTVKEKIKSSLHNFYNRPEEIEKRTKSKSTNLTKYCLICNSPFISKNYARQKTCSRSCGSIITTEKIRQRVKDGTHKGWTTRPTASYPEKYFQHRLKELNIPYEFNHPVPKNTLGVLKSTAYFLDFYFPDIKLNLEIDGKQHLRKERRESDLIRDELLTKNGYHVFRIPWINPINNENKMKLDSKFNEFLTLYNKLYA